MEAEDHDVSQTVNEDNHIVQPDSKQQVMQEDQQEPEAMQEDPVKPVARPARLQPEPHGAQGTPKAVASTLVRLRRRLYWFCNNALAELAGLW